MKNRIVPFDFSGYTVRTVIIEGTPWWAAGDVAKVLGFRDAHTAIRGLDEDEKGTHYMSTPGGVQIASIINESGLYSLILRSNKPEAKSFKRWITHEVLPQIRKAGGYSPLEENPTLLLSKALLIADSQIKEYKPKAEAFDAVMDAHGLVSVWEIGKATIGPNKLFKLLGDRGHFYRQDGHWLVKQSLIERGLFAMKVKKVDQTQKLYHRIYATPKGESWILQNVVGGVQLEPAL